MRRRPARAAPEDLEVGCRYARSLFAEIMLYRCGKTDGDCRPRGHREDDVDGALRFIEAGRPGITPGITPGVATGPLRGSSLPSR